MAASPTQCRSLMEQCVMDLTMALFTETQATFFGQPICGVVATTHELARRAADVVDIDYEPLDAIVTIRVGYAKFLIRNNRAFHRTQSRPTVGTRNL